MTKREALVIGAYTGVLMTKFSDLHEYIEEVMERPVFTHELASTEVNDELKAKCRPEFLKICEDIE
jgi:hypothetical protein